MGPRITAGALLSLILGYCLFVVPYTPVWLDLTALLVVLVVTVILGVTWYRTEQAKEARWRKATLQDR